MYFKEVKGNVFSSPLWSCLAHCISADCAMSKGIAVLFKNKFGHVHLLRSQNPNVGNIVFLTHRSRYIYYLVTKSKYYEIPKYDSLRSALCAMKEHMEIHSQKYLALPKIGCGLDKLQWSMVKSIIFEIFHETNIHVTVYHM